MSVIVIAPTATPSLGVKAKLLVKTLFGKYALATNTGIFSVLLGAGDCIQQKLMIKKELENGVVVRYDWLRTLRMSVVGLALGPMHHYWFKLLDRQLRGTGARIFSKKVLVDQLCSPMFSSVFISGLALMEGQNVNESLAEYRRKFWKILAIDWTLWTPVQLVNFALVPAQARVLFVSSVQVGYNGIISHVKHEEE